MRILKINIGKAKPLKNYLISENEKNIEEYTQFLNMLNKIEINEIEKINIEQEIFKKQIPFKIKSHTNYLWQIYWSEFTNRYFMLVTIEDLEYSAFFYLLKKQLEDPDYEIFVPISYVEYNNAYLTKTEISEMENYIWLFTKQWPLVYEVYDKKDKLSVQIVGETIIYENIKSIYKISLENRTRCN